MSTAHVYEWYKKFSGGRVSAEVEDSESDGRPRQSLDNARSVDFSQLTNSPRLIEDETFNDSDINNLIDYEDGQIEKYFLKIYTYSERSMEFQNELRSCISGYRDIYKQLNNQPSLPKRITYFMMQKNKSTESVPSSDKSDFELFHQRKMHVLDYDK
ncbi:uncharacterized protein TNCV_3924091 [Trichonephila clavipes]|nr:uncharacterized protein TNCV_3924091 [Trichonephila clavipes]